MELKYLLEYYLDAIIYNNNTMYRLELRNNKRKLISARMNDDDDGGLINT